MQKSLNIIFIFLLTVFVYSFLISSSTPSQNSNKIYVQVRGAVNKPGVYLVKEGTRTIDLIGRIGLKDNADTKAFESLNLAEELVDAQSVVIKELRLEENDFTEMSLAKVSINNSTSEELQKLVGIGPSIATKIISGRPYESLNDLLEVEGIGIKSFENIVDDISL